MNPRRGQVVPAAFELGSGLIANVGSAVANIAFHVAGPAPVIAVRQSVAAVVLLGIARPKVHRMRWPQIWPALLLGACMVLMNLSFAFAIQRLPLGLAVTLQFLGPLTVALLSSRRALDILIAIAAFSGVVMLTGDVAAIDWIGVAFVAVAAFGWAAYILLSQFVGRRHVGLEGSALSMTVAAICTMPIGIITLIGLSPERAWELLGWGALCGLLSTVIPQAIDMTVLRVMDRTLFAILQSANPAFAALAGFVILGQSLAWLQIAGLAVISLSNAVAVLLARRGGPVVAIERTDTVPIMLPTAPIILPTGAIPVAVAERPADDELD